MKIIFEGMEAKHSTTKNCCCSVFRIIEKTWYYCVTSRVTRWMQRGVTSNSVRESNSSQTGISHVHFFFLFFLIQQFITRCTNTVRGSLLTTEAQGLNLYWNYDWARLCTTRRNWAWIRRGGIKGHRGCEDVCFSRTGRTLLARSELGMVDSHVHYYIFRIYGKSPSATHNIVPYPFCLYFRLLDW